MDEVNRKTGKVKWFDNKKGYGFIAPDDGSGDIFVHHSAIRPKVRGEYRTLTNDEPVSFIVFEGAHGAKAGSVERLS